MHCYGRDDRIIAANAQRLGQPGLWTNTTATNLRQWLVDVGIAVAGRTAVGGTAVLTADASHGFVVGQVYAAVGAGDHFLCLWRSSLRRG